jgi:protein gp37
MGANTGIQWADHTFNPWIGCTKVGPGCDHCYAERDFDIRLKRVQWGAGKPRLRTGDKNWQQPRRWNRKAALLRSAWDTFIAGYEGLTTSELAARGFHEPTRPRVFCASLADVFDNEVPQEWRDALWALIRETPHLDWMLLTKRIGNVSKMLPADWGDGYPNVWLGVTVVNQAEADRDIPKFLAIKAHTRFLSIEPVLGPIDLSVWLFGRAEPCAECPRDHDCECGWHGRHELAGEPALHWVICGGESGPHARPAHPDWFRSLRDQCAAAKVAFFFKQWSEWGQGFDFVEETRNVTAPISYFPELDRSFARVGVQAAGRKLDGVEHNALPKACGP